MPSYTLVDNRLSGELLHHLRFQEAPPDYDEPGQFVAAGAPGEPPSYFAIASSPGEPLELLVKRQPGAAGALCELEPGGVLQATSAQGPGFRAATTRPDPLVCLVNGSALSAVRPVLRAEIADGLPRPVHLLYGVLSLRHVAFAHEIDAWAKAGVQVEIVLDTASADHDGPVGFVQDRARALGLIHDQIAVLLCGVPPMVEQAKALYQAAGLDPARMLTNY